MAPRLGLGGGVTADPAIGLFGSKLLLDAFPNAHSAFSVRKLRSGYGGYAMKVRESGNDYTADVSFDDNGFVSASSLIANKSSGSAGGPTLGDFIGSADGHVHTWYDQSGNGRNASDLTPFPFTTAANQPKIYSSGSLETSGSGNATAALLFDSADKLHVDNAGLNLGSFSAFLVFNQTAAGNTSQWFMSSTSGNYLGNLMSSLVQYFYYDAGASEATISANDGGSLDVKRRLHSYLASTSQQTIIENGTSASDASPSSATDALTGTDTQTGIGNMIGYGTTGHIQEVVFYPTDQIANNAGIVENINADFSVY